MEKPNRCPRCLRNSLVETETRRYQDDENQLRRWDNDGGHDEGMRQDLEVTMREVLWTCTFCGWNRVGYSAQEPHLGPEKHPDKPRTTPIGPAIPHSLN